MPVGPHILWPEKARKSQPISWTSTGRCPALCAASTSVVTPSLRARAHRSATGLIVPSELEMWVIASNFTWGVRNWSRREASSRPMSPVTGRQTSRAPVCSVSSCQGTILLWCSISVSRMMSPARTCLAPQACATRLMPSVVPRVKMISSGVRALTNWAARARAASKAAVARLLSSWMPRWTLALSRS